MQSRNSRFVTPSAWLQLPALVGKTRRVLGICLLSALIAHLAFAQLRGGGPERQAAKPLTTQFIKRQPRLSKPLELKKRPQPRRRTVQRRMVSVEAKLRRNQQAASFQPARGLRGLATPTAAFQRAKYVSAPDLEPMSPPAMILGTKEVVQKVDVGLELLNIEALDTGQYRAMVIQDPRDKRNIRGFFHIGMAYSVSVIVGDRGPKGTWRSKRQDNWDAIVALAKAMNRFTRIKTDVTKAFSYDSAELLKTPWIYTLAYSAFELTRSEAANLGRYLTTGGFHFADVHTTIVEGPDYRSSVQMFKDALTTRGLCFLMHWNFERLPDDHAIYHSFFDLSGLPVGSYKGHYGDEYDLTGNSRLPYLNGIHVSGVLVAVLSNQGFSNSWVHWGKFKGYNHLDNTLQLQFGVNTIIFALTREGSITNRVMDTVAY